MTNRKSLSPSIYPSLNDNEESNSADDYGESSSRQVVTERVVTESFVTPNVVHRRREVSVTRSHTSPPYVSPQMMPMNTPPPVRFFTEGAYPRTPTPAGMDTSSDVDESFCDRFDDFLDDIKSRLKFYFRDANWSYIGLVVGLAVLAVLVVAHVGLMLTVDPIPALADQQLAVYKTEMKELFKRKYSSLSPASRATARSVLSAVGTHWIRDRNPKPLLITVAGKGPSADEFSVDVARVAARAVDQNRPVVRLDARGMDRAQLHREMKSELIRDGHGRLFPSVVVVSGVDGLSWDAPLALQAIADGDNIEFYAGRSGESALATHALIIATVHTPFDRERCGQETTRHLDASWIAGGGAPDNVTPVTARVAHWICL